MRRRPMIRRDLTVNDQPIPVTVPEDWGATELDDLATKLQPHVPPSDGPKFGGGGIGGSGEIPFEPLGG